MAEAGVSTADEDAKMDKAIRKMFETAPFVWNKKDELETNKPEEGRNVDNSKAAERLAFNIIIPCVGPFGGGWSKGVFIEDYTSPGGAINKNPYNRPVIGIDLITKNLKYNTGEQIRLQIWNLAEQDRYFSVIDACCKRCDGVIVFWSAREHSMDIVLKYKDEIRKSAPTVPILLLVDNVFPTPRNWVGQGLAMNSMKEMDNFCLEHGFFAWFEMVERGAGEDSDFGRAMSKLVDEIMAMKRKYEPDSSQAKTHKPKVGWLRGILSRSVQQAVPEVASNVDNSYGKENPKLTFEITCNGADASTLRRKDYMEDYTSQSGRTRGHELRHCYQKYMSCKSGRKIKLYIWNQHEYKQDSIPSVVRCGNIDGAIVFWDLNSDFMDTVLEYKNEIRRSFPTVPILLLIDNVLKQPVEWIGQGLLINSMKEMDNFCLEHGFFTWFEMRERGAGEDSDFGRAVLKLVNEMVAMNGKYEAAKPIAGGLRGLLLALQEQPMITPEGNVENSSTEEALALKIACNGADTSTFRREDYMEQYTSPSGRTKKHEFRHHYNKYGKTISLYIWNQHEDKRGSFLRDVRCGNGDGAIVFWDLNSDNMNTVLEYKNEIRRSFPTIPILLLIDNVLKQPVEWIGQGLLMNSTQEMDNFCLEHGFFSWFEMFKRSAGEDSDFGRAISKLVDEIIAKKY